MIRSLTARAFVSAALALAGTVAAAPAAAIDFSFSFSSDLGDPSTVNAVAGTVFGHIVGLTDNATSAATSVFIDSYSVGGFADFPTDAVTWTDQDVNSFTVVGGVLAGGMFHADNLGAFGLERLYLNIPIGYPNGNTNYASTGVNNAISIWNNNGFAAISQGGMVPEPATWGLLIGGFAMVGVASRRRRTTVAA